MHLTENFKMASLLSLNVFFLNSFLRLFFIFMHILCVAHNTDIRRIVEEV